MLGFGGKKNNALNNTSVSAGAMRDERQTSAIILNAIEDGVMLIDHEGVIQLFNPGAEKITGWPVNEARKLDYRSVIKLTNEKGEAYTREQNPLTMIFNNAKGAIRDNKAFLITRNGRQVPISLSVSPLTDERQTTTGAVAVFRDVTQERLEEKQRSEFISTASHEMRTPVAAIEGYLALALNDRVSTVDERARGYLEKAHESTQHLWHLLHPLSRH